MINARPGALGVLLIVGAIWFSSCDLPTEAPSFDFTTSIGAPLLLDQTYVLIGPGETGHAALIDTTKTDLDTLFSVEPGNQTLFLNQELDEMEIGELDGVFGEIDLNAIEVDLNYAAAYVKRGMLYERLGNFQQAIADYDRALQITDRHG